MQSNASNKLRIYNVDPYIFQRIESADENYKVEVQKSNELALAQFEDDGGKS